ncbi:S8 family peptidase [Paenibacillus sp. YIM B09110]|uniref:S8 family peptidase n=1 Tax=Paenibacillus sp. YIM B09110 TaxID=3126102 RepID=UPI00301DB8E0
MIFRNRWTLRQSAAIKYGAGRAHVRRALLTLVLASVALGGLAPAGLARHAAAAPQEAAVAAAASDGDAVAAEEQPQSWLLKWSDPALAHELRGTEVLRRQSEAAVDVVRPAAGNSGEDAQAWLARLQSEPGVEYVHPNSRVHALALATPPLSQTEASTVDDAASFAVQTQKVNADDPELSQQPYLAQIGALIAWEKVREQKKLTIAIVDTGIDLDHPDLVNNLVPGVNLVNPKLPPNDDNGHGTSVAGVIAAETNNGRGVAGIIWKASIMPIKALDNRGDGTEEELGDAILYAIKSGARIVVLSVGLHRYSPYMLDIVEYAESKGVLLVAAAGNDGVSYGAKAAVKYPAAYSTVIAVGGVKPNGAVDARSNPGPELDIMAPWNVFTTGMGGLYKREEGTSMAAPQVAAAAGLIWAQNPDLKPYQVRALLRQTAKDIGTAGVDSKSGYGLLQIDKAVNANLVMDIYEPNDTSKTAKRFQLGTSITASLESGEDQDWYRIDMPSDGTLTIDYKGLVESGKAVQPVRIYQYFNGQQQLIYDTKLTSTSIDIDVKKGAHLIRVELMNQYSTLGLPYMLTSSFIMKQDAYESNDKSYEAYTLQPRGQTVIGNFHQAADRDWYVVSFTQGGKLKVSLSTDTARIDPGLAIQRAGDQLLLYDDEGEGKSEQSPVITVVPGKYYIRVHNAISSEASPVIGTYALKLEYTPKYVDPNEGNDKSYESFMVNPGTEYVGVIGSNSDLDWFQFRVNKASVVSMAVSGVPSSSSLKLEAYDKRMSRLTTASTGKSGSLQSSELVLQPGIYYVKLSASVPFDSQYYRFKIKSEELLGGFRDISNHWAKNEIIALSQQGIINGMGNYRFEPQRAITRAEAVAMAVKAYKPSGNTSLSQKRFNDVSASHWAYDAIAKAVQQGWVKGFPDGSFRPDQPITRVEMAVIIGYADGVQPRIPIAAPFTDVSRAHWAAPMLIGLKANGAIKGVEYNQFKPNLQASRAEYSVLLYRLLRS